MADLYDGNDVIDYFEEEDEIDSIDAAFMKGYLEA